MLGDKSGLPNRLRLSGEATTKAQHLPGIEIILFRRDRAREN
jgi:hypothetical protein